MLALSDLQYLLQIGRAFEIGSNDHANSRAASLA